MNNDFYFTLKIENKIDDVFTIKCDLSYLLSEIYF